MSFLITEHAIASYSVFYPKFDDPNEVRQAVIASVEIEAEIACRLVGREGSRDGSRYWLSAERTGVFVSVENRYGDQVVVTFLRFYALDQYRLASKLYPGGLVPKDCVARWISALSVPEHPVAEAEQEQIKSLPEQDEDAPSALETLRTAVGGILGQASSALKKKYASIAAMEASIAAAFEQVKLDPASYRTGNEFDGFKAIVVTKVDGDLVAVGRNKSGILKASRVSKRSDTWALESVKAVLVSTNPDGPKMQHGPKMQPGKVEMKPELKPDPDPDPVSSQKDPSLEDWVQTIQPPDVMLRALGVNLSSIKISNEIRHSKNIIHTQLLFLEQLSPGGLREGPVRLFGFSAELYLVRLYYYLPEEEKQEFWLCTEPEAQVSDEERAAARMLAAKGWKVFPPTLR